MLRAFHRHLTFKIFLSYLLIILIGAIILVISAEFAMPRAFNRHLSYMMGDESILLMGKMGHFMRANLYDNYRDAFTEALTYAAVAAFLSALLVSILISRQIVSPIQSMKHASQKIADGHYEQRVPTPAHPKDADELAQLALSFNQMAEQLSETEQLRQNLISDISHELRTPLTAIQGSMEGLIDGVLPASPETFLTVYQEADRLKRLVNDLQELSRVEAGSYSLDLKPVAAAQLIQNVVDRLSFQFEDKGVSIETEIPENLPNVLADEDRILQVLLNLVGNALQFTPTGEKVTISASLQGKEIRFTIIDSGIGIPPDHLPHLFDRFYRVDKSRSRAAGGSGIGLTIARHLVEAHGGKIYATSQGINAGSQFTFTLPTVRPRPLPHQQILKFNHI
jgi:signal transduction histidine kinase